MTSRGEWPLCLSPRESAQKFLVSDVVMGTGSMGRLIETEHAVESPTVDLYEHALLLEWSHEGNLLPLIPRKDNSRFQSSVAW